MIKKLHLLIFLSVLGTCFTLNAQSIPINPPPWFVSCDQLLLMEEFEGGIPGGWTAGSKGFGTNAMIDEGWYATNTNTPTPNTGPDMGLNGPGYMYYEVSGIEKPLSTDTLKSPPIVLTGTNILLEFDALLYGADVQNMYIDITSTTTGRTNLGNFNGPTVMHNSSTSWERAFFDLSAYAGQTICIEFIGEKNGSPDADGDIAIDNVTICSVNQPVVPTMGTWGLIILAILLMIFSAQSLKSARLATPALINDSQEF